MNNHYFPALAKEAIADVWSSCSRALRDKSLRDSSAKSFNDLATLAVSGKAEGRYDYQQVSMIFLRIVMSLWVNIVNKQWHLHDGDCSWLLLQGDTTN